VPAGPQLSAAACSFHPSGERTAAAPLRAASTPQGSAPQRHRCVQLPPRRGAHRSGTAACSFHPEGERTAAAALLDSAGSCEERAACCVCCCNPEGERTTQRQRGSTHESPGGARGLVHVLLQPRSKGSALCRGKQPGLPLTGCAGVAAAPFRTCSVKEACSGLCCQRHRCQVEVARALGTLCPKARAPRLALESSKAGASDGGTTAGCEGSPAWSRWCCWLQAVFARDGEHLDASVRPSLPRSLRSSFAKPSRTCAGPGPAAACRRASALTA